MEKESIRLAKEFLVQYNPGVEVINSVASCIQATHLPQEPKNLIEEIICDADLYHLGTNMFIERNDLLKRELQAYNKSGFSEEKWLTLTLKFLKSHEYFTSYCKTKLEKTKQNWIELLQNKQITIA